MSNKQKWFSTISCGNGMIKWELIEDCDYEEAERWSREDCIDFAQEYGYEQDGDHFGELDSLGKDWDEESEEYGDVSELHYYVEKYDPEEHDGYLE